MLRTDNQISEADLLVQEQNTEYFSTLEIYFCLIYNALDA